MCIYNHADNFYAQVISIKWSMRSHMNCSAASYYSTNQATQIQNMQYLGSLGDLLPLEIFGDFFPTQSSLSSMSLESEQLQLSIMEGMKLFPYTSSVIQEQNEPTRN